MKLSPVIRTFILICSCMLFSCAANQMSKAQRIEKAQATQRLGEEQYRSADYTNALKHLLEALADMPDDHTLHNSLGLAYLAKQRPDLAQQHFEKALIIKPDYIFAQNNLGGAFMAQKKWNAAIRVYKKVADELLYATPEMPLSNIGWAYLQQGLFKRARTYFNEALDLNPGFLNAIHGMASIYMKQGNYYQALAFINDELKKNPGAAILHADLARTYNALGDFQKAKNAWNVVLKLVPERSPLGKEARKSIDKL